MSEPFGASRDMPGSGESFGPYHLGDRLGQGSSGIVFRATKEPDGVVCALKILRAELWRDDVQRQRFVHEARATGAVQHPHLVPIIDAGEVGEVPYLAQAFIDGRTLRRLLADDGPLPLREACEVISDVAAGLDALHRAGLVHRDVKSSNVMLETDGTALLTDFGLSRGTDYTVLTMPGQILGTLDYLAPELIRGEDATTASDVYALGCLAYETFSGAPPFASRPAIAVGVAHLGETPDDPFRERDDDRPDLAWAVLRALEKAPSERPGTATAYAHLINTAAGLLSG